MDGEGPSMAMLLKGFVKFVILYSMLLIIFARNKQMIQMKKN